MRSVTSAMLLYVLAIPSGSVLAQACVGAPSFKEGNMRLGAGASFNDNAKSYGAQFATGVPQGPFAALELSTVQYNDVSGNGAVVSASGGWAIDIVPTGLVQVCPLVGFSYQNGPNVSTTFGDVSTSAHAFAIGGSFGGIAMTSPGFDFVPFAGYSYNLASATASAAGLSSTTNQNYGELSIGSGFVINHTLTIQPAVNIPVGLEDGKTSFTIAIAFNFGARAARSSSGAAVGNR